MLLRPLTDEEAATLHDAARIAVQCYDAANADPKVVIPSALHAAMFKLKQAMELK